MAPLTLMLQQLASRVQGAWVAATMLALLPTLVRVGDGPLSL
jgi:hypothetical protein